MNLYQKTNLPSGITIITENIKSINSFLLGFWINTGSVNETKRTNGLSHFVEHMLFKGTRKRSSKKISDEIEATGGYLNAFTTKEQTCFYGRGLTPHLTKTFSVLADMYQNSLFEERAMKKEAGVILDELYDIEDSPEELIFDKFENNIFKGNSLSYPIIGTEKNILNFTQNDIKNFVTKNYSYNNLTIIALGNISHQKIIYLAEKYFLEKISKQKNYTKKIKLTKAEDLLIEKDMQQTNVIIGAATAGVKSNKRTSLTLLTHILGDSSSSRLFQRLREKNGIAYQVNSFLNLYAEASAFGVYLSTNKKLWKRAIELIHKEFQKISQQKVPEKELRKAKEYLKGQLIMGQEKLTNRMARIAAWELYFGATPPIEESIIDIEKVTAENILSAAQNLLTKENLSKIIIH